MLNEFKMLYTVCSIAFFMMGLDYISSSSLLSSLVKKKVSFSFQVTSLCSSEAAVISQWVRENYKFITFVGISGNNNVSALRMV